MQFSWREGTRHSGDPQVVGERIEALRRQHGDTLRPADIVDDARPQSSPLHGHFNWDDSSAAEAYRRVQARRLMSAVYVIYDDPHGMPKEPTRAYVSINPEGAAPTYVRQRDAASTPSFTAIVTRDIRLSIDAALRRAREFTVLAGALHHLEAARAVVQEAEAAWREGRPTVPEPPPRRRTGRKTAAKKAVAKRRGG
jgi:hypothetical protein